MGDGEETKREGSLLSMGKETKKAKVKGGKDNFKENIVKSGEKCDPMDKAKDMEGREESESGKECGLLLSARQGEEDKNAGKKCPVMDEDSEERIESEEDREGNTTDASSELSIGEIARRQIRQRNLENYKMIRTKKGLKYESDLTLQEKKLLEEPETRYNHSHVGRKIVEAFLIPSAKVGSSEANKNKILRYVHSKGYRVTEIKDRDFARIELGFDNYAEANRCIDDRSREARQQGILFEIPYRAKWGKGIITGWDLTSPLDELVDAMVSSSNIVKIERLMRKSFNREENRLTETVSHVICVTWEGNCVPSEVTLYGGISGLKVKPYVDNVLQCYGCYRYGHLLKHCKAKCSRSALHVGRIFMEDVIDYIIVAIAEH